MLNSNEIENKYTPTLCALMSYKSIGFFSREYSILQSENTLMTVFGEYEMAEDAQKKGLYEKVKCAELLTYRELFDKIFLAIEDFVSFISALTQDLSGFHINITKSQNVKNVLSKMTNEKISKILKYGDTDVFSADELQLVNKYRNIMLESTNNLFESILKFYNINEKAYVRMKHGNSLFYNTNEKIVDGINTFILPVQYNLKEIEHVDILVLNKKIYKKTKQLFFYIQNFLRLLCDANIDFISTGEFFHPLGIVSYPSEDDANKMQEILQKYIPKDICRYSVNANLLLKINERKLDSIIGFYDSFKI